LVPFRLRFVYATCSIFHPVNKQLFSSDASRIYAAVLPFEFTRLLARSLASLLAPVATAADRRPPARSPVRPALPTKAATVVVAQFHGRKRAQTPRRAPRKGAEYRRGRTCPRRIRSKPRRDRPARTAQLGRARDGGRAPTRTETADGPAGTAHMRICRRGLVIPHRRRRPQLPPPYGAAARHTPPYSTPPARGAPPPSSRARGGEHFGLSCGRGPAPPPRFLHRRASPRFSPARILFVGFVPAFLRVFARAQTLCQSSRPRLATSRPARAPRL
jgi:hypothetical protein